MARLWQYFVVGESADRDRALARARTGEQDLVRTVAGRAVEQTLDAEVGWREPDTLARITHRADEAWEFAVSRDEAQELISLWRGRGRLQVAADADELVARELDERLAAGEKAAVRQRALLDGHGLDARTQQRVRDLLDPVSAHLAAGWVRRQDALVVPVPRGPVLAQDDDSRRTHAAFTLLGEEVLHAVPRRANLLGRSADVPDGLSCPNDPDWIAALGTVYLAQIELVLTGPARTAALFWAFDYGLVAGPPVFVEAVLGGSVDDARERFRAYARHELPVEPAVDVADVVARYLPD